jgi:hypothetical protein
MTRLALAKTIVQGTVTLQGNMYTFTGSGSGTATADMVPEAKKLAVAASNTAAIAAARASINKILADNSAVLTDLEITSLISNNLSTIVVAFKPIALATIATTADGVNYLLNENVTIEEDQICKVPAGKILTGAAGNPFTNNGYFQIYGTFHAGSALSKSAALKGDIITNYINNSYYIVDIGGTLVIAEGITFTNANRASITNNGTLFNNGTINNSGSYSYISNYGTLTNNGTINNSGSYSSIENFGTLTNNGTITNSGSYSSIENANYIQNTSTSTTINYAFFYNNGSINNNGQSTSIENSGKFYNNGPITNTGKYSSTYESNGDYATWTTQSGGTCSGNCQI